MGLDEYMLKSLQVVPFNFILIVTSNEAPNLVKFTDLLDCICIVAPCPCPQEMEVPYNRFMGKILLCVLAPFSVSTRGSRRNGLCKVLEAAKTMGKSM